MRAVQIYGVPYSFILHICKKFVKSIDNKRTLWYTNSRNQAEILFLTAK